MKSWLVTLCNNSNSLDSVFPIDLDEDNASYCSLTTAVELACAGVIVRMMYLALLEDSCA